jgi:hypothetical protein
MSGRFDRIRKDPDVRQLTVAGRVSAMARGDAMTEDIDRLLLQAARAGIAFRKRIGDAP